MTAMTNIKIECLGDKRVASAIGAGDHTLCPHERFLTMAVCEFAKGACDTLDNPKDFANLITAFGFVASLAIVGGVKIEEFLGHIYNQLQFALKDPLVVKTIQDLLEKGPAMSMADFAAMGKDAEAANAQFSAMLAQFIKNSNGNDDAKPTEPKPEG